MDLIHLAIVVNTFFIYFGLLVTFLFTFLNLQTPIHFGISQPKSVFNLIIVSFAVDTNCNSLLYL
jgi:hypothetical protein